MAESAATLVLVHGAWHGAWCWEQIVERMAEDGVRAVAVDLPGHGADRGPMGDLHGDADRVREVLDTVGGPVVLVGHSYGGAVITEAGDHPAVEQLVFLCALVLDADETCARSAVTEAARAGITSTGGPDLTSGIMADDQGNVTVDPAVAAACLYNHCEADTVQWAVDRLGPQPLVTFDQTPTRVAWRVKPSTYVVCADDRAVPPDLQRILARRCTGSVEWDSDHSPFLSHQGVLTGFLVNLAKSESTTR